MACALADILDSLPCAFYSLPGTRPDILNRRARAFAHILDGLARAFDGFSGAFAHVFHG